MTDNAILLWAAGGPNPARGVEDEDALLTAVLAHHLEVRLEHRLATDRPAWATATLCEAVAAAAEDVRRQNRRQLAALAEIVAGAAPPERPILAKGLAWHLLTGQPHMRKRCIDLDLFSKDPAASVEYLTGLGYTVDTKDPPVPFGRRVAHEYASLRRDGVHVDLHRAFPAWRYPEAVATPAAVSPRHNPGEWACPDSLSPGQLAVDGLFAEAVERPGPGDVALAIPGREMAAVLSCCHVFANYVTEFPRPRGTVRLAEVANVAELVTAPGFDRPRFARLVADHGAADAVAYVFALAERWLGHTLPPAPGARLPGEALPPRSLWFARGEGTFLASTAGVESPDDVLVRATGAGAVARHLGAVPVEVTAGAEPRWYTAMPGTGGQVLARRLVHRTGDETFGLRVAAAAVRDGLRLVVETPHPGGAEVDVLLDAGSAIVECIEHPGGERHAYDRTVERRIAEGVAFDRVPGEPGRARYTVAIPWARLGGAPAGAGLPVLLGVRRWHGSGRYPVAGTLVPLLLTLGR